MSCKLLKICALSLFILLFFSCEEQIEKNKIKKMSDNERCDYLLTMTRQNDLNKIKMVVEIGVNINCYTPDGDTALHIATENGNLDIIKYLVEKKANIKIIGNATNYPIYYAIIKDRKDIVEYYLQNGFDVNEKANSYETLLVLATKKNKIEMVKFLISKNAKLDYTFYYYWTLYIALDKDFIDLFNYFMENNPDLSKEDGNINLVRLAALKNNFPILKTLIEKGLPVKGIVRDMPEVFDIDTFNSYFSNLDQSDDNLIKKYYVFEEPINTNTSENDPSYGEYIEGKYKLSDKSYEEFPLEEVERIKDILERNGYYGANTLHIAIQNNNLEMVKFLVEKGLSVSSLGDFGFNSIHYACLAKEDSIIPILDYLIEKGANYDGITTTSGNYLDLVFKRGLSPLTLAILLDKKKIIQYLKNKNAIETPEAIIKNPYLEEGEERGIGL
ncbi:MAG: hypothetical protein A2086_04305 [Spirochaetes bacterium GWD1_27_9]|nr:MAG: hypothetical protein A2Z98_06110 [Spirochaetes bacterium GWB1_27_13]OHD22402.1 MAG: hypothetical protein A2Y34_03490 [Spirochaetes bacterium GWC1_27_15]OHD41380.1 MAG: hypothetical protein A2086_04305 [Spirochaetes bacterium GWD1_27_9]